MKHLFPFRWPPQKFIWVSSHVANMHEHNTREQLARSLGTLFATSLCTPYFQRRGACAMGIIPRVDGVTVRRLLCPIRLCVRAVAFRWGLPCLLPTRLDIPHEVSRVRCRRLKRNGFGGVLLAAPSALCGSPVCLQGRSGCPGVPWQCPPLLWPLLLPRFSNFGRAWLTSQTRDVRGVVPRRAMHAASDSPCHSSAQPPLLGGLPPPHGACQEHAAHLVEWSTTLRSKGSSGTCIPEGVSTFFHAAFTAHSGCDAGADAVSGRLHTLVQVSR
jgi:hypothetical protein